MVRNLPRSSLKSSTESSPSTYSLPPPTTCKQMYSANKPSRHSSSTSASTVTIGKTGGEHPYLLHNIPTTPKPLRPTNSHLIEVLMALIHPLYTLTITTNSLQLPQKNGCIQWLQCTTLFMTSSIKSTTNKVPFMLKNLDSSKLTIGSWLVDKTSKWRLGTINH